jgi:hypothetical protein
VAIIANKTVVLSNNKPDAKESSSKQKEINARQSESEERTIENHAPSNEKSFLVRKPSQFMHDMLNDQNKQE